MCSINEEELEEIKFMEQETPLSTAENLLCKKCNAQKSTVVLRKKDPYCNDCFLASVTHKFRASLGKAKLIRPGDKVLIAYNGDESSSALAHLVKDGLKENTHKKLRFEPVFLYVDEGAVTQESIENRKNNIDMIMANLQAEKMPTYVTSLSDSISSQNPPKLNGSLVVCDETDQRITELFNSVASLTAQQDLLKKLRLRVLISAAVVLKCQFIFVADTATNLAAGLLANIALGSGAQLSSEASFCDSRDHRVKILRPMRDFTSDDLKLFVQINGISYVAQQSLTNRANPYASIQSLTQKFVRDLQQNFPATIPTVLRTGDKTESKINSVDGQGEDFCCLCHSPLDTESVECSALVATEYSREMSNSRPANTAENKMQNGQCGSCNCGKNKHEIVPTREEIEEHLCYSCRLLTRDVAELSMLPKALMDSVKMKRAMDNIKDEIKDFLL